MVPLHAVSAPLASSPAALVVPAGHATHALFTTCSFTAQRDGSVSVLPSIIFLFGSRINITYRINNRINNL